MATVPGLTNCHLKRHRPTPADGTRALRDHVLDVARKARALYGPVIDWPAMQRILGDRSIVRYPVAVTFDDRPLLPGELAFVTPSGEGPADGFQLFVDPQFAQCPDVWPLLMLYQLVVVNYGDIATHEEAELFGATVLGLDQDDYYQRLCDLADGLPPQAQAGSRVT